MNFWSKAILLCGALSLTAACGVFETEEKGKKFQQSDSDLADQWKSRCLPTTVLELSHTVKDYRYSALGDFDRREYFYDDEQCNEKLMSYQLLGTYQALGKMPEKEDLKQINYTVTKALITPETERAVEILNTANVCGISDWKVGEETEVTGKECLGYDIKKGDVIYGVYQIVNKDTLYVDSNSTLGGELQLTSRPNEVNKDIPLKEQD